MTEPNEAYATPSTFQSKLKAPSPVNRTTTGVEKPMFTPPLKT